MLNAQSADINTVMKKKRGKSLEKTKSRAGWLFVLPFVLGLVFIYLPIIIDSIGFSFMTISYEFDAGVATPILTPEGFSYYRRALFEDAGFVRNLVAGLKQLVFDVPVILIFSLFIAVVLNQKMLGRAVFRAIFFVPVILSTGLMESINASDLVAGNMQDGGDQMGTGESTSDQLVNAIDIAKLFEGMMVGEGLVVFVTDAVNNIYDIVNRCGVQMLIFLAGLQSISASIYEACKIDGASAWETFWKVTFPMISPMILVNAVYTIIDSFTSTSNIVMSYISTFLTAGGIGPANSLGTAMSWLYFLMIIVILAVVALVASTFVFYQKRN